MDRRYLEMELWYSGLNDLKPSFSRIRKFLLCKLGRECSECGFLGQNPYTNKFIVELDHIDGDRENNFPSNLRLLCPNCHAMTPTYKSLNTQKSRADYGICRPLFDDFQNW